MAEQANEVVEQVVREAPKIEAFKLGLLDQARQQVTLPYQLPAYQVAGMSPQQVRAEQLATSGIGAYEPYLQAATTGITQGQNLAQAGSRGVAGINVAPEFAAAQRSMQAGIGQAGQLGQYAQAAGAGFGDVAQGARTVGQAARQAPRFQQADLRGSQQMLGQAAQQAQRATAQPGFRQATGALGQAQQAAQRAGPSNFRGEQNILGGAMGTAGQATQQAVQAAAQPGFGQGVQTALTAAQQAQQATTQPGFGTAQQALTGGIGTLAGGMQGFDPSSTQDFMNPYQQQVIDEAMRQINRQGDIARQQQSAQAVQAGAFGGTREGVQRAEMDRALAEQRNAAIVGALQQGYGQAQQAAMGSFEQQQQRQIAAGQGIGALGSQTGQLAATQAGLGQQAAQQLAQAGQLQTAAAGQSGQLGLAAAQQRFQEAGFDANTAMQLAQLQQTQQTQSLQQSQALQGIGGLYGQQAATQAGLGQQAAQQLAGIGTTLGQQQTQQAQLGQAGTQLMGSLGAQQAQLGLLPAQIAAQQGQLAGQGAQLYGQLGQGIGGLATQQAGVALEQAGTLGQLGQTVGQLGVQQAALGQAAQQMGQADIGMLGQLGGVRQANEQARLDASRATQLQTTMAPYQQLGFLSDIYKGAPSSQMALTAQSAPSPSPVTQAVGLGISGLTAAAGASRAGLF